MRCDRCDLDDVDEQDAAAEPAAPAAASSAAVAEERTEFEERLGTKPQKPGLVHRIASVWKDEYDTAMNWPRGRRHLMARGLTVLVVNTIALLVVTALMPSIHFTVDEHGFLV